MKKYILLAFILSAGVLRVSSQDREIVIKLYQTTDVHGNFFPFDFINNRDNSGSLARVSTFIKEQRALYGENILLLDGGDVLQGQPAVYYYNFIDTVSKHLAAEVFNYIGYDIATIGNHDIEPGHSVYDRWISDCGFPVLGANIIRKDGTTYLPPYAIFDKEGVKIAVVGMITEAIPAWLPENLWSGLHFAGIEETARKLLPTLLEKERPDIVIGLFHTGVNASEVAGFQEGVGLEVAERVPGFDVIFCGHDHAVYNRKIANVLGDSVLVINPAAHADKISEVTIKAGMKEGRMTGKDISGEIRNIAAIEPDKDYMLHFQNKFNTVREYVDAEIGTFTRTVSARDAFFGPSDFIDLLHRLQLEVSGAQISLTAPLSQNARIDSGKVYVRDMFNLYRYENLLYTMQLTGKEIKDALEYCYALWTNQMKSEDDHLLLIKPTGRNGRYQFEKPSYSFDSAAGILYEVDVTQPAGQKVNIVGLADGSPFEETTVYSVAVNSYQGSGGGGILTEGAGIPREKLGERIISSTDKDLRYYLTETIKAEKVIDPMPLHQWKFVPEGWVKKAAARDYRLLFGEQ